MGFSYPDIHIKVFSAVPNEKRQDSLVLDVR